MTGLIALALELFPALFSSLTGNGKDKVAEKVANVFKEIANTDDPTSARASIKGSPEIADTIRVRLAEIAVEVQKNELAAAQAQRDSELKAAQARAEAEAKRRDDEFKAAQEAASKEARERADQLQTLQAQFNEAQRIREGQFDQIKTDIADTQNARELNSRLLMTQSPYSWINPVLSLVIVGGFLFFVVTVFYSTQGIAQENKDIFLIAVGSLAAAFSTVIGFHFGSSSGSKQKDIIKQAEAFIDSKKPSTSALTTEAVQAATGAAAAAEQAVQVVQAQQTENLLHSSLSLGSTTSGSTQASSPPSSLTQIAQAIDRAVSPAGSKIFVQEMPNLLRAHRHFPDAATWALTPRGVSVDGSPEARSPGTMVTIPKIWDEFGRECVDAARRYGVPVELIVATIATESTGNPSARRVEPDGRESVGLMQTLVDTARGELGASLRPQDLLQPAVSINAGASYIARQRATTRFDPPLVAAAYNAGSLRRAEFDSNRWRLVCTPKETGAHIDRFIQWFGDAMVASAEDGWGKDGTPSFAAALSSSRPNDIKSPGFPGRPNFEPLTSLKARQDLFGTFEYRHTPQLNNREHIDILGTWERENIITVTLTGVRLPGKNKDLSFQFHKLGERQLRGLWEDWRNAGLLERILTFDGGYNPRFQRGSTSVLSNHAFGSAFDINAETNPLGAVPAQIGELGCVRELVPIANKWGFYWGGHFRSRLDGMHFEIAQIIP